MPFPQLRNPKSPLLIVLPVHVYMYVSPVGVTELDLVQPVCQSSPHGFNKCFFQRPVSVEPG